MADMYDNGVYTYNSWRAGDSYTVRWDGPFDDSLDFSDVYTAERRAISLDRLEKSARTEFERGWRTAQQKARQEGESL